MDIPLTIVGVQRICLPVCVVVVTEGIRVAVSKAPSWSHEDTAGSVLNVVCIVTVDDAVSAVYVERLRRNGTIVSCDFSDGKRTTFI